MDTVTTSSLPKLGRVVHSRSPSVNKEWTWVPAMGLEHRRSRMVTGNQGHGGAHINQLRDDLVCFLNNRHFSIEIAVFSSFIGGLEVEEGKIKGFK